MESRIKTKKNKIKLSKKKLNYQNNLALITKLPSLTLFPPTKLNSALNVARAIKNTGRKWYLLSDMESESSKRNHMIQKQQKIMSRGNKMILCQVY